jgi:hypothetical protein
MLLNRTPGGYLRPIERGTLFVAEQHGRVIGFGEAARGTVIAIYVHPAHVCHGVGTAILRYAVNMARAGHNGPIRLEATLNAQRFYERAGFREVGRSTVRIKRSDSLFTGIISFFTGRKMVSSSPCRLMTLAMPRFWLKIKPSFSCVGFANTLTPSRRQKKNSRDSRNSLFHQQNPPFTRKTRSIRYSLVDGRHTRQIRPTSNENAFRHGLAGIAQRRADGVLNPAEPSDQGEFLLSE